MYFSSKISFSILPFLMIGMTACHRKSPQPLPGRSYQGVLFNVPYTIDVVGDTTDYQQQIDSITGIATYHFDLNNPNSTLSRYNHYTRTDSAFTFYDSLNFFSTVYAIVKDLNFKSNQLYDPSTGPLKSAWIPVRAKGLSGEPNLDSLFRFVGFDGVKTDLTETYDGSNKVWMRKADPRISLDFTDIAAAYTLDQIGQFFTSLDVTQYKIFCGNKVRTAGIAVADLNSIKLGMSENDEDNQEMRLINRSFAFETFQDKQNMVDPTYGYPLDNEFLYVGVSAKTLVESVSYSEIFMIMGLEATQSWYERNAALDVQSLMVIRQGDLITTASTSGFDAMLILPDSLKEK